MRYNVDVAIPRDSSPDVHRGLQQTRRAFQQVSTPWYTEYRSITGLGEGQTGYYEHDDGRMCKYFKLDGKLYCVDLVLATDTPEGARQYSTELS